MDVPPVRFNDFSNLQMKWRAPKAGATSSTKRASVLDAAGAPKGRASPEGDASLSCRARQFPRAFEQQRDPVSACDIAALQAGFNVSPAATMVDYRL
jgi:hypothetical protein